MTRFAVLFVALKFVAMVRTPALAQSPGATQIVDAKVEDGNGFGRKRRASPSRSLASLLGVHCTLNFWILLATGPLNAGLGMFLTADWNDIRIV